MIEIIILRFLLTIKLKIFINLFIKKGYYIFFVIIFFKVSFIFSQISKENEKTRIDSEIRQLDVTNEKNFKELELNFANSKLNDLKKKLGVNSTLNYFLYKDNHAAIYPRN